jgi:hypothetical protein
LPFYARHSCPNGSSPVFTSANKLFNVPPPGAWFPGCLLRVIF